MKDIRYIDLQKVEEIASASGSIQTIADTLNIKKSILMRSLYYTYAIKNKALKKQYIELGKAIRRGQSAYNLKLFE